TDVIIESAVFDPVSIRRTAFRYSLRSEASLRFEKGQEHGMARIGADRTAALIGRWAGGRIAVGAVDSQPDAPAPVRIGFRPTRIDRLLGEHIAADEQRDLLERVEIGTEPATTADAIPVVPGEDPLSLDADELGSALVAIVPGHRRDLAIEADIAEEIARIRGYETVRGQLPDTASPQHRPDPRRLTDAIRDLLAGSGLTELVTHGLVSPIDHERLGFGATDQATIRATNPVTIDHSELRRSLVPGHVRVLVDNERQRRPDLAAFEIGAIHRWQGGTAAERDVLGLILAGHEHPVTHDRDGALVDVATVKGLLERVASRLLACRLVYEPLEVREGVEHPGRTAAVIAISNEGARHELGRVGALHPRLLDAYDARGSAVMFCEIDLAVVAGLVPQRVRVGELEQLPAIERDIALVVDAQQAAGAVEAIIREIGGTTVHDVRLFDVYRGTPLESDQKSLAYRIGFTADDGAMNDGTVESMVERMVAVLSERLGARLRA
ncbi:MAG: phenylalanine--tRNA ligase beta subunit-related protein, partial [Chloroflexota bacterium]